MANKDFPHAPSEWTFQNGITAATQEGLDLEDDHWDVVRALQEYFHRHAEHPTMNMRDLHDALDEKFHSKGGIRFLYRLFPGGPVAQGCRVAGLLAPGATDKSYGSVA